VRARVAWFVIACVLASCGGDATDTERALAALADEDPDYCALAETAVDVLATRPGTDAPPIDDVNWFARPVPHDGGGWIIAFASHDQNWLYDLSSDRRVRIPDRSDAVATPDGRYMTVPSYYTSDSNIRFYPIAPMLDALERGEDVQDLAPTFVHDHPSMHRVYYQSTGLVSETAAGDRRETIYRLMFSGTGDESQFRIVDYRFAYDAGTGALLDVVPSEPMAVCPAVQNDLNTPFISKDGRYVAAYTSEVAGNAHAPGASLKIFEITATDPRAGTTTCAQVADLGFAAGKADFSFDGSMLTFHLSQGAYLTPFVNGGLPSPTITDVMVARLTRDAEGRIDGYSGLQRLTTSLEAGVGSYFPAFFPDGRLFYIGNAVPRDSEEPKRFHFRVVDPASAAWRTPMLVSDGDVGRWAELGALWQRACSPEIPALSAEPFPLDEHERPLQPLSLRPGQCAALVRDARAGAGPDDATDWSALGRMCIELER
jgi:hypothetical protein